MMGQVYSKDLAIGHQNYFDIFNSQCVKENNDLLNRIEAIAQNSLCHSQKMDELIQKQTVMENSIHFIQINHENVDTSQKKIEGLETRIQQNMNIIEKCHEGILLDLKNVQSKMCEMSQKVDGITQGLNALELEVIGLNEESHKIEKMMLRIPQTVNVIQQNLRSATQHGIEIGQFGTDIQSAQDLIEAERDEIGERLKDLYERLPLVERGGVDSNQGIASTCQEGKTEDLSAKVDLTVGGLSIFWFDLIKKVMEVIVWIFVKVKRADDLTRGFIAHKVFYMRSPKKVG